MTSPDDLFRVRRYSDIASELLRQKIMDGSFLPGGRLNEAQLSRDFEISRPPLREALRVLAGEGLVSVHPGKGAFVTSYDLETVESLGELRAMLEAMTARLAAERADDSNLQALEQAMRQIELSLSDSGAFPTPVTVDFHTVLAEATKNPALASAVTDVERKLMLARVQSGKEPVRARQALVEHRAIGNAVIARDADAAERAMRAHIDASTRNMIERFTQGEEQ